MCIALVRALICLVISCTGISYAISLVAMCRMTLFKPEVICHFLIVLQMTIGPLIHKTVSLPSQFLREKSRKAESPAIRNVGVDQFVSFGGWVSTGIFRFITRLRQFLFC